MIPQIRVPVTEPFARIDGLPVAVAIVDDVLAMKAWFKAATGYNLIIYSGIRTYEDQVRIFKQRYVTAGYVNGRRVYDVRRWQGVLWYRISAVGTVAQPGTSNHESGRALDLRDDGPDAGVAASFDSPRNRLLSANLWRFGFTHTGKNFAEPWHVEQLQVADPWGGLGKPLSIHITNPGQALTDGSGGDFTSGGGGSAAAPTIQSEEDDMRLYRVTPRGRHYAVAPGFIKQISDKESVKSYEKVAGVKEVEIDGDEFAVVLGVNGISTVSAPVVDGQGRILDERDPAKGYVTGGSWARADKAERYAYLAQKR